MAKKGMRPEVRAQKLKNNKAPVLLCSVPDCEEEYYVAYVGYPTRRVCRPHFDNPPQVLAKVNKRRQSVLFRLGLIS